MVDKERFRTGFRTLRLEALWSQRETAETLEVAQSHVVALEKGRANPHFNMTYHILIGFARALNRSPKDLWPAFYPDESCVPFEPIVQRAATALISERVFRGSYRAKRDLRARDASGANAVLPEAADMRRLQHLFATTPFTLMELADLTSVSKRRLDLLFGPNAELTANMSLTMFTQIVAAFAPVHGASIPQTAAYLLAGDLTQLEELV